MVVARANAFTVCALGNAGSVSGIMPKSLGRGRATTYLMPSASTFVTTKTMEKTKASFLAPPMRRSTMMSAMKMVLPVKVIYVNSLSNTPP